MTFILWNPVTMELGRQTPSFDQAKSWADASPGVCVVLGGPGNVVYQSPMVCAGCGG